MSDFKARNICPDKLSLGACGDTLCQYNHEFRVCYSCPSVETPESYTTHAASPAHIDRIRGNCLRCSACDRYIGRDAWAAHLAGKKHLRTAKRRGLRVDIEPEVPTAVPDHRHCTHCNLFVPSRFWSMHTQGKPHKRRANFKTLISEYVASMRTTEDDLLSAVTVLPSDSIDFSAVNAEMVRQGIHSTITISTASLDYRVTFLRAKINMVGQVGSSTPSFSIQNRVQDRLITPGNDLELVVIFRPNPPHVGQYNARLLLHFSEAQTHRQFSVTKSLHAAYRDLSDHLKLQTGQEYTPPPRLPRPSYAVIPAIRPRRFVRHPYTVKLRAYSIPKSLQAALDVPSRSIGESIAQLPLAYRPVTLEKKTYVQKTSALLWCEEHRAKVDIRVYDRDNVRLEKQRGRYLLDVPGLAENRPSVILGDGILVRPSNSSDDKWFEGLVVEVLSERVALVFAPSFKSWAESQGYSIQFTFNRVPGRRQHQALNRPFNDDRIFFPLANQVKPLLPAQNGTHQSWFNQLVQANQAQKLAVETIQRIPPGSTPFVVFGPPGTGKTSTCVEAILQLLHSRSDVRILACAPSNSAADELGARLLGSIDPTQLYRFYAPSRTIAAARAELLNCTKRDADGAFVVPGKDDVLPYRIVVATCGSASFALNIGMEAGHFTHIFVDEAGQASEPELMVPIKGMASSNTTVILSGDPKQLGPIIRSPIAREMGLGKSFLERLMDRQAYDEKEQHGKTIVKLVNNFRSHPDILVPSNHLFYGKDLIPLGQPEIINAYTDWSHLPKKGFPVIFHSVYGEDKREASSPSYFNIDEITQVKTYVQLLLQDRQIIIEPKEIGVITPYHAQAQKLRSTLRTSFDLQKAIQVASVELFQGQERKVIIMSTVRSTQDMLAYDLKHTLGFVSNPRRFNVSVTRAKALLIVVGNPAILGLDPLWRAFLNWVYVCGGWAGPHPPWDPKGEIREDSPEAAFDAADLNAKVEVNTARHGELDEDDSELDAPDELLWRPEDD